MKHLETFESAAKSVGIDPAILPVVTGLPEAHGKAIIAGYKLFVISQASWEGKKIDWNDYDQRKYFPWFDMETYEKDKAEQVGSGVGFSYDVYDFDRSVTGVGSRLVFPTSEIAKYVGKTHLSIYRDLMVIE
ncbi:hypothetical protein [Pedobacter arcticus]|uniref:hypothetical protein n=1 Tax=Pedobacter arcticus TaxID=752140 RepID=UPI0002E35915|nr:hypothetical protein [Pedobacter arcticus]